MRVLQGISQQVYRNITFRVILRVIINSMLVIINNMRVIINNRVIINSRVLSVLSQQEVRLLIKHG